MHTLLWILTLPIWLSLAAGPAAAQDTRYSEWSGAGVSPEVRQFFDDLNALIDEADRSRAADPQFIADLRDLMADFQNPWKTSLLFDDFRDGNYTANPAWAVSAGNYVIDSKGGKRGLRSDVGRKYSGNNPNLNAVLGALLNPQGQSNPNSDFASIYTPVKISNAFAIRLDIHSSDRPGRFDFGPYQGATGSTAYRIAYMPGAPTGLQLLKVTSKGTAVLASSSGPINLGDGRRHLIEWTRDRAGAMEVKIDGNLVASATDFTIRQPFNGFYMINSGGNYHVATVAIDGSK